MTSPHRQNKTYICHLLRLPPELRMHIYSFILPTTVPNHSKGFDQAVWVQRSTTLLATNRQIHEETANYIYGQSRFVLSVDYSAVRFVFRRLIKSGLKPVSTPQFLSKISPKNIRRIRHVTVHINVVDGYTGELGSHSSFDEVADQSLEGMIKYNCGGAGLVDGYRKQVEILVDALQTADSLQNIRIILSGHHDSRDLQRIAIEPFQKLANLAQPLQIKQVASS